MSYQHHVRLEEQGSVTVLRGRVDPGHDILQLLAGDEPTPGSVGVVLPHARVARVHEVRIRPLVVDGEREPGIWVTIVSGDLQAKALHDAVREAAGPEGVRGRGDVGGEAALRAARGPAAAREAAAATALLQAAAGALLQISGDPPGEPFSAIRGRAGILVQVEENVHTGSGKRADRRIQRSCLEDHMTPKIGVIYIYMCKHIYVYTL